MPIKLGPFVIEGHRPDWVKTKYPGAKERVEQQDLQGVPLPVRRDKPLLKVSRTTPYTRYPSVEAVNMAVGRLPLLNQAAEVSQHVKTHLAAHRATTGGTHPRVLILGERHGTGGALAMALAAIRELRNVPGEKRLMLEMPREMLSRAFPADDPGARKFMKLLAHDQPLRFPGAVVHDRVFTNFRAVGLYAQSHGFSLQSADPLAQNARNQEERESGMLAAVGNAAASSALTVVWTGSQHVPELHEKLSQHLDTVAIAMPALLNRGDTHATKRMSYLLSMPQILTLNASDALNATPLDAVHFINHVP